MNKVTSVAVIAFLIGVVFGYSLKRNTTVPKPQPQEKAIIESSPQKNSTEWKIQNAKSAAPETVSKDASVLDWPQTEGAELQTLLAGTNDWTCLPDYPVSPGNDPLCADKQAMVWFGAYMTKKTPQMSQTGFIYMLQGGSDPSNTDPFAQKPAPGESWLSAPAHVMMLPTGKLDPNVYGTDYKSGKPWIMWVGTPYEHLMIPVK